MRHRLWQIGFMLSVLAAFVIGGVIAQSPQVQVILRGQRIELTDSSGKVLGLIAPDSAGNGSIKLYDKAGKVVWTNPPPTQAVKAEAPKQNEQAPAGLGLTVYGCALSLKDYHLAQSGKRLGGQIYANGYVKNESSKTYANVTLSLVYYDKTGVQVGTGRAVTENLRPGAVWKFSEPTYGVSGGVASFAVADVKAK